MAIINIKGRASFCHVFKKQSFEEGEPKFQCTALVSKADQKQVRDIRRAIEATGKEKWGAKWEDMKEENPRILERALREGVEKKKFDGYDKDTVFVAAGNTKRPLVLDRDRTPLTEEDGRPYSGCHIIMRVEFWAQANNYGKFINASLLGVQFVKDGEAFGGGAVAGADDFEDLDDEDEDDVYDQDEDDLLG